MAHNQLINLSEICTLKGGNGFPVNLQGGLCGDVPFIKVSDMNSPGNEVSITGANNWVSRDVAKALKAAVIPAGSVVFAKVGAALLLNRRRKLVMDTIVDNNMMAATPNGCITTDYLYYFLQTVDMKSLVQEGALPSINQSQVGSIKVNLPPIEKQREIAACLSTWDRAIELHDKLIALKEKQKQGLMQVLLADCDGFNQSNASAFYKIADVCAIGRGRVISKTDIAQKIGIYPVYSSQTSNNGCMGYIETFDFDGTYITWTTDGAHAGTVFFREGKFNCTNVCGTLKVVVDFVDSKYLSIILSTVAKKYVSTNLANPKLMNNVMGSIEVPIPSISQQKRIADIVSVCDAGIDALKRKRDLLNQQKQGLMQQLLG